MHKWVGKPKWFLPYISPYLSSIMCGCVQNRAADTASQGPVVGAESTKVELRRT